MAKRKLQEIEEQAKSQHKHWESMSPDKRRASVIQMRDAQSKNAQKSIIILSVVGVVFFAFTVHFWLNIYHLSIASSSGIIGGAILAVFGFRYIQFNRIKSHSIIQPNDFNDDDIMAYIQEHEKVNQRALINWNRYKYLIFVLGGLLMLSLNLHPTKEFSFMVLSSGLSIFLLGLFVHYVIQKVKK